MKRAVKLTAFLAILLAMHPVRAQEGDEKAELAKKLQNPVANLISFPLQNNWDFGIGPENAMRYTLNVQPVIPVSISEDWMVIIRTILPVIHAESPVKGGGTRSGLGDTVQSLFVSPKGRTSGGLIWGVGPAFLWPTGTDDALGSEKWGAGPTAVILRQDSGWTYGLLGYQIWSYAGAESREDVSTTFLQPFVTYTTRTYTTIGVNTESTYDWVAHQWTVPINLSVTQLIKIGGLPLSFGPGARVYARRPDGGPDWGIRFNITMLFPK